VFVPELGGLFLGVGSRQRGRVRERRLATLRSQSRSRLP